MDIFELYGGREKVESLIANTILTEHLGNATINHVRSISEKYLGDREALLASLSGRGYVPDSRIVGLVREMPTDFIRRIFSKPSFSKNAPNRKQDWEERIGQDLGTDTLEVYLARRLEEALKTSD